MTTDPCSSTAQGDVKGYMTDQTAAQTHVCYGGYTFYVLNANRYNLNPCIAKECPPANNGNPPFEALPGGTFDVLSGGNFGGVTLDDIVISSYQGYQLNANQNGYQIPDLSKYTSGNGTEGDFIFQAGIQTPGFISLPICSDVAQTIRTITNSVPSGKFWPCPGPGSTNIVSHGYVSGFPSPYLY
jgi:hypothetical protein